MDLVTVITEGSMKALAIQFTKERWAGLSVTEQERVLAALRQEIQGGFTALCQEALEAIDAHMGEPMARQILNVGCNLFAVNAMKALTVTDEGEYK